MSLSIKVGRSAVWAIIGQAGSAVLSLANFAIVGRYVSPTQYGNFLLAMSVLIAVQWLSQNAYKEPLIQSPSIHDRQINSVFTFSLLVGLLSSLCMVAAAFYFYAFRDARETAIIILILAAKLLFDSLVAVPTALRAKQLEFKFLARLSITANLTGTLANIGMLIAGFGLIALAFSQLVTAAVTLVAMFYYANRKYAFKIVWEDLSVLRGYSIHIIFWQGIDALNQTVERLMISSRISLTSLGLYGFGKRLNDVIIDVLIGATSSVSLPAFAQLQHDRERLQQAFLKSVRIMTLITLPVIATLYATAADFVPLLFGQKWAGAIPIYRWFLLLGILQTVGILQGGLLRSLWFPGVWSRYMLAQTIANLTVLYFASAYGVVTLIAAQVIRAYIIWGWIVLKTCRALKMRVLFYVFELSRPVSIAVGSSLVGLLVRDMASGAGVTNTFLRLVLTGAVVMSVFAILAVLFLRPAMNEAFGLIKNVLNRRATVI